MMSLLRLLPNLLLLLSLMRAAAVQPIIKNLVQSGETIVLQSPDFPNPYTLWPSPKFWQIRWALQVPAHLQILFSDLRLHPDSRLELYDGDLPAFRLTPTARLLVRYESGADYWRRIALTADSGVLTVVFTPLTEPDKQSSAFSWMGRQQNEVHPATPKQPIPGNIDYEGFRIEIKLFYYASSAWLERPWSDCGWLQYTADSVSLLGTVWRHFDCVWVLRPPAGTKAWMQLRAHKLVKDSYQYDMEVHDGGTSAATRLGKVTSGASSWQPEQVFISARPLYVRIRGNFSDSANHLVLQYHFFSIAAAAASAAAPAAASPPDCSKISPGFESCNKLNLCVLPVCYKLPELSACGSSLNCSLGPADLRSCLLRLYSHDGQRRGAGLRPRTLCSDRLHCVPLSLACPAKPAQLLPPWNNWKRHQPAVGNLRDSSMPDSEAEERDSEDGQSSSSSSSSLNVLASLGGVCLAAVALIGLGFAVLTVRSRRRRRRLQFQRHQRQPAVDPHSTSSLMRVFRLGGASRRLQLSNARTSGQADGEDECFSQHPPPPTPPPAYSEVFGSRRPRTGQSPPKPPSAVATAAAAATSANSGGGGCGEPSSQQAGHQRHRHSRHRQELQVEPQSTARCSAAPSNTAPPADAAQPAAQPDQPQQDRPIHFEQPHTVRLPPLHGAC